MKLIRFRGRLHLPFLYFYSLSFFLYPLLLICIFSINCSTKRIYGKEKLYTRIYRFGESFKSARSYNYYFGAHLIKYDTSFFIIFLDTEKYIVLKDLNYPEKNVFKIPFEKIISKCGYFSVRFENQELHLFDLTNKLYTIFEFTKIGINQKNSLDISPIFTDILPAFQYNNCFEVNSNEAYLSFSINDKEHNYRDKYVYLKINLSDSIQRFNKNLYYPDQLRDKNRYLRNNYPTLNRINDSIHILGFEKFDSLYLININSNKIVENKLFERNFFYRPYDSKKSTDLSYVRWYDETSELNQRILSSQDSCTLIIRREKRDKLISELKYSYYFLDKKLNVVNHNIFKHSINPDFSFVYQNGFLIFDKDLTTAYYYEN